MCFLSGTVYGELVMLRLCGPELGLTRAFGGRGVEGRAGAGRQRRSPLLVRVCVPGAGMCGKGLRTWEGGLVWETSSI